jgi:hypothetical protein
MRVLFALSVTLSLLRCVQAEEPVHFADEHLKTAVEEALWFSDPTPTDMLGLTSLNVTERGIVDLAGLEYATNLQMLWIRWNDITDLSPLAGLVNLQMLDAHNNPNITDISPLSGLVNLEELVIRDNRISDISPLAGLTRLKDLHLEWNQISDISALAGLTDMKYLVLQGNKVSDLSPLVGMHHLIHLNVKGNPLSGEALGIHIPQIRANNPNIWLEYEDRALYRVRISSTAGGSVTFPGEGLFVYKEGMQVDLTAQPDPGFVFAGWSGTYLSKDNSLHFNVREECTICANFVNVRDILYVDDDGPSDARPGDPAVSDPAEDGTARHPFDRIQEAIDVAADHAIVVVRPGTYRENIDLLGKRMELTGFDPNDPRRSAWPVIDGGGSGGPVASFGHGEDANCILQGFVITGGKSTSAVAIRCSASSPTIANCLIVGNCAADEGSAAVYCTDSSALLVNCTMADNCVGRNGAALRLENSPVLVVNSILWGNTPGQIVTSGARVPSIRYSCIGGGWSGAGNIDADPEFASLGLWVNRDDPKTVVTADHPDAVWVMGDYHLRSQAGRWDPKAGAWVQDAATSPCIDAGDPNSPVDDEPSPNGGIIDMGAYGGTTQASLRERLVAP